MTSAVELGRGGPQKADKKEGTFRGFDSYQGEGFKKSKKYAHVIYVSPLSHFLDMVESRVAGLAFQESFVYVFHNRKQKRDLPKFLLCSIIIL